MRKSLFAVTMLAVTVALAPACASKKFVRTEVGGVNQKVDTLSGTVEETQEATRRNATRIGEVDQKAEAAGKSADAAGKSAQEARAAADGALKRAEAVGGEAKQANTQTNQRIDTVIAESRRLVYTVTLSEDQGNFKFGNTTLPDDAKARLDAVVNQLKSDTKGNIYIEIEGHTDNVGSRELNQRLGLERAEEVKRYLYEQHQIPLHKMNVISYGEEKPVSPNNTREGRAQNRRVVVKVLS
jgi:outer membrane protein OmpA-like peptidoglycan-associated protein